MAHDLVVLADEIYARIVHEGEHHSILAVEGMEERTIVLDGLSKTYAMTGWRLGWGILPPALVPLFERLLINTVSCTATYAQIAGAEALNGPQDAVAAMVAEFRARRSLIVEGLDALPGVSAPMPSGAFYAFPDVSGTGMTGGPSLSDCCRRLVSASLPVPPSDARPSRACVSRMPTHSRTCAVPLLAWLRSWPRRRAPHLSVGYRSATNARVFVTRGSSAGAMRRQARR